MAVFSSPLSQENRIQLARASFSSSAIAGARSLNISPVVSDPLPQQDPETLRLLEDNQSALVNISGGINSVRQSVEGLNQSLSAVSSAMYSGMALEQSKESQKAQQERILAEDAQRDENEALLERKLQSSATAAVQPVAQNATNSLNSLMGVFKSLFLGWLGFNAIQTVQSYVTGNKDKLGQVKNIIGSGLNVIGEGLKSIKTGFDDIINNIRGVAANITETIAKGAIVAPFRALFGGFGKGAESGAGSGAAAAADDAGKGVASAADDAGKGVASAADDASKGLRGMGGNILRGASGLMSAAFGVQEFSERKEEGQTTTQAAAGAGGSVAGAEVGALTGARVGSLFGPLGTIGGAIAGGALGWMGGGNIADMFTGANTSKQEEKPKSTPETPAQTQPQPKTTGLKPQTPAVPPPVFNFEQPPIIAPPAQNISLNVTQPAVDNTSNKIAEITPSVSPVLEQSIQKPTTQPITPIIPPIQIERVSEQNAEQVIPKTDFQVNFGDTISNYTTKLIGGLMEQPQMVAETEMRSSNESEWLKNLTTAFLPFDFSPKEESEENYIMPMVAQAVKSSVPPSQMVGPLPEPQPNVIVAPLPSQQQTVIPPAGSGGIANNLPNISPSNSSNFYVSYSQVQYNVVI